MLHTSRRRRPGRPPSHAHSSTAFWSRRETVSTRVLPRGGALLYDPDRNLEQAVNSTGLQIWMHLDGTRSLADLTANVARAFGAEPVEAIERDVSAFLDHLHTSGFAAPNPAPASVRGAPDLFPRDQDAPRSLDVSVTGRCNLHCPYCFYADEMQNRPDAGTGAWLALFRELRSLGVRHVTLSGGEVFCREDLGSLIDAAVDSRLRYDLLTNGTLITERLLSRLEQGGRRDRLDSIQVSIDGSSAEVHDRSRGPGAFQKAIRGLHLLVEAGLPVTVRTTVNRFNVSDLEALSGFLLEEIGVPVLSTNDAVPIGAGCRHQDRIGLTPRALLEAMVSLVRLETRYPGRVTASAGPLAKWHQYRSMEHARRRGTPERGMGSLSACSGMFHKLAVHHDGTLVPCNMLSTLMLGCMGRDGLRTVWTSHSTLESLRNRHRIPMRDVPGCEDCPWALFCNGSCPGPALTLTGDANRANPHDCYRLFLRQTGLASIFELDSKEADRYHG